MGPRPKLYLLAALAGLGLSEEVRFGLVVPQGWQIDLPLDAGPSEQLEVIVETSREAERLGFDSVWFFDHFHTIPRPGKFPVFECWFLMSVLSRETRRARLGQIVTCSLYRNPGYLAKLGSMVDVASGGRLEMGLGACWYEHEFKGYGYEFPSARKRIEMMEEYIEIIKRFWTEDVVNYRGRYFNITEGYCHPKPLQKPRPPILVGGGGEKLTLRVVAKHADKWNYGGGLEVYKRKLGVLKAHCEKVGRDLSEIVLTYTSDILVADSLDEARRLYLEWKSRQKSVLQRDVEVDFAEYASLHVVGSPKQALGKLRALRSELGIREFIMYFPYATNHRLLKLLWEEVVAPLKEDSKRGLTRR